MNETINKDEVTKAIISLKAFAFKHTFDYLEDEDKLKKAEMFIMGLFHQVDFLINPNTTKYRDQEVSKEQAQEALLTLHLYVTRNWEEIIKFPVMISGLMITKDMEDSAALLGSLISLVIIEPIRGICSLEPIKLF